MKTSEIFDAIDLLIICAAFILIGLIFNGGSLNNKWFEILLILNLIFYSAKRIGQRK